MGAEVATIGLVVAAVGAASSIYGQVESSRQASKAAKSQKEAQEVSAAQQRVEQAEQRRQQVRQERIKRAQIEQASANTGVSGSSGELGSVSALGTNMGNNLAISSGRTVAANAITGLNQATASAQSRGATAGAIGSLGSAAMGLGIQAGALSAADSLFGPSKSGGADQQVDNLISTRPDLFG